jgi:hypothetical protein
MSMHGIFDGKPMQAEDFSDLTHLMRIGFVQPDPHEAFAEFADLRPRGDEAERTR